MAITKSAKKAHRAAQRRRVFNLRAKKAMKDVIKDVAHFISSKKGSDAVAILPKVYQAVDKAAKAGVIKANAAARIKSRLMKRLRAVS